MRQEEKTNYISFFRIFAFFNQQLQQKTITTTRTTTSTTTSTTIVIKMIIMMTNMLIKDKKQRNLRKTPLLLNFQFFLVSKDT